MDLSKSHGATKTMRILLITGSFPPMPCGIGDYTAQLAEALGKLPNMTVAVLADAAAHASMGGKGFDLFPVVRSWNITSLHAILKVVRDWRPDIIHMQYPSQAYGRKLFPWLLPAILLLFGNTIIQTWHEYYANTLGSLRNLLNAILPTSVVVVRPRYKDIMPAWHRWLIRNKLLQFIPNASSLPLVKLGPSERKAIREQFVPPGKALVTYFGFIYPHKGVEHVFDIADPTKHHLVLIGRIRDNEPYHKMLLDKIRQGPWSGHVTTTGFLPPEETGRILAAADAVLLPFRDGGGLWNTSFHGAAIQGTFVLTTSQEEHGYDAVHNVYFAHPGDMGDMRRALDIYLGYRTAEENVRQYATWDSIAEAHRSLYERILT